MINGIRLNQKNISPNQRRVRLQEVAGIKISNRDKKILKPRKCECVTESVSQVLPSLKSERDRVQSSMMKQFKDLEDDDELDLSELNDEISDEGEYDLDEILKEMGYGEDNDDNGLNPSDFELTDEELQGIMDELEKDVDEELNEDKGYKEARKLIKDLRSKLFRSLSDSELNSFMDELSNSFSLK